MASSNILEREVLEKKTQCEIPRLPLLARRGFLCFRCWKPSSKMTKCSGCRRTYYCTKACQTCDWDLQHKKHCKLLRKINEMEEKETARSRSWELWQESLYQKVKYVHSVSPDVILRDTVQGQSYCSTCYRSGIQAAVTGATLIPCAACHVVFHCSDCELSHLKKQCLEYQCRNEVELIRILHFEQSGEAHCRAPSEAPRSEYCALSMASDWIDYLANFSNKEFLQLFSGGAINLLNIHQWKYPATMTEPQRQNAKRLVMYHLLATDTLTMPVTIVAALEDCASSLANKSTLSIHLLGANTREIRSLMMFEEILHLWPNLIHLKITLISPAGTDHPSHLPTSEMQCNVCETCSVAGRTRSVTYYQGLYHDFAQLPGYVKPELAVLFHSGRTQDAQEGWRPTTRLLVTSGILTLCTTWNLGEAIEETAELDSLGARLLVRPEVNRWRSLLPWPEFNEGPEHGLCYNNWYRYVFQGRR